MNTRSLAVALLAASLTAQLPPPPVDPLVHPTIGVGWHEPQVVGHFLGVTMLDAYASTQDARGSATPSPIGVGIGGAIYWRHTCLSPAGAFYPFWDAVVPGFAVAPFDAGPVALTMPGSPVGFDQVRLDMGTAAVVWPMFLTFVPNVATPWPEAWVIELRIPNDPALIGSLWAAQAWHVDPGTQLLYFSDAVAVEVRA